MGVYVGVCLCVCVCVCVGVCVLCTLIDLKLVKLDL